jgi:N-methylhydantoinase B
MVIDSVEIDEGMYPILIDTRRVGIDTMGCGQWNGAPATEGSYYSLTGDMTVAYCADGDTYAAKGVLDGTSAAPSGNWKRHANGELEKLPSFHQETCAPFEAIVYRTCAGGGYGDPCSRDPALVAKDVSRQWLSKERAEEIYKTIVKPADNGIDYVVDEVGTAALRNGIG